MADKIPAEYTIVGNKIIINPTSNLDYNKEYKIVVSTGVKDVYEDELDALDDSNNFTTGNRPALAITSVLPIDDDTDIAIDTNIVVTFDTNINATTAIGSNIYIKNEANTPVTSAISVVDNIVTLNPSVDLSEEETYTLVVTVDIEGIDGGKLLIEDNTYQFTTIAPDIVSLDSFYIDGHYIFVADRDVLTRNTVTGAATHYMISRYVDFNGATWETYTEEATVPFRLYAIGLNTIYFKVKDANGESSRLSLQVVLAGDDERIYEELSVSSDVGFIGNQYGGAYVAINIGIGIT